MVYADASVTDVACAGLNGMRMGERTLTVRRATESAPNQQMGAQHTGMMPAPMNQAPPMPEMPASRIIRCVRLPRQRLHSDCATAASCSCVTRQGMHSARGRRGGGGCQPSSSICSTQNISCRLCGRFATYIQLDLAFGVVGVAGQSIMVHHGTAH